jgi:3D (Asp-Asp-Asp) domain-containing protein
MRGFQKVILVVATLGVGGCLMMGDSGNRSLRPPADVKPRRYVLETTGYCACQECCGWHRNWLFMPVSSGGHYKQVGYTASGSKARPGTIAADTSIFPFGTIMFVPGYGYGRVEDRGGDIKGWHIDCFFNSHGDAREWGKARRYVDVWLPQDLSQRRR